MFSSASNATQLTNKWTWKIGRHNNNECLKEPGCTWLQVWEPCRSPADVTPERGKYLSPGMCFDLWEFELCIIRVHFSNLLSRRCPQHLEIK